MLHKGVGRAPGSSLTNVQYTYLSKRRCWGCLCSGGMGPHSIQGKHACQLITENAKNYVHTRARSLSLSYFYRFFYKKNITLDTENIDSAHAVVRRNWRNICLHNLLYAHEGIRAWGNQLCRHGPTDITCYKCQAHMYPLVEYTWGPALKEQLQLLHGTQTLLPQTHVVPVALLI